MMSIHVLSVHSVWYVKKLSDLSNKNLRIYFLQIVRIQIWNREKVWLLENDAQILGRTLS